MRESAAQYLRPGEPIQAVIGAQTASQWLAALTGFLVFLGLNRYRILAVTRNRILVLDAGKTSMKTARGVVAELPRSTRLGPGRYRLTPAMPPAMPAPTMPSAAAAPGRRVRPAGSAAAAMAARATARAARGRFPVSAVERSSDH